LSELLSHRDPLVRQTTVSVLSKVGSASALARLPALLDDPALSVRKVVVTTLGAASRRNRDDAMASKIAGRMRSKDWQERAFVVGVLATIPLDSARQAVLDAISFQTEPIAYVRIAAIEAAKRNRADWASAKINEAGQKDPDPEVRKRARAGTKR
jgi:HEAT repeat protein